jgi:hypothetical protein
MAELMLGKEGVRKQEHEAQLKRERESHALVWTGTEGQLVEEIKKLFDAGLVRAKDLPDALQKAAIHFVDPDGKPIIKPASTRTEKPAAVTSNQPPKRLRATVNCPGAARKMEAYLEANGIGATQFAIEAQTTDRTIRSFRKTGRVRRDILDNIAKAMQITKEALLKD